MMRRNILFVVGLLALLAGSALALLWLVAQRGTSLAQEERPELVSVLGAAHRVTTGALLRPDDMTWVSIPAAQVQSSYVERGSGNEAQYVGALARRDFDAAEPLATDGLVRKADRSFLSAVLAPGDRAVTIPSDASQTASGLIMPGDHVDVVLTQNLGDKSNGSTNRQAASVILQDVRVVALEQALGQTPPPVSSSYAQAQPAPRTVTLELSERDAEKLLVATQLGRIDLVVRALEANTTAVSLGAPTPVFSDEISVARPIALDPPTPVKPADAPAPSVTVTRLPIEVMHGAKIEMR